MQCTTQPCTGVGAAAYGPLFWQQAWPPIDYFTYVTSHLALRQMLFDNIHEHIKSTYCVHMCMFSRLCKVFQLLYPNDVAKLFKSSSHRSLGLPLFRAALLSVSHGSHLVTSANRNTANFCDKKRNIRNGGGGTCRRIKFGGHFANM